MCCVKSNISKSSEKFVSSVTQVLFINPTGDHVGGVKVKTL